MMRWLLVPLAGLALLPAPPTHAQSIEELRQDEAERARAAKQLDRADAVLMRAVAQIPPDGRGNAFPAESVAALLAGWRSYTERECVLVGGVTGGNGAARGSFAAMCETRRYGARLALVEAARACLSRAAGKEGADASACLEPLVVLKAEGDFEG